MSQTTRRLTLGAIALLTVIAPICATAGEGDSAAAFERIKALAGSWSGTPEMPEMPEGEHPEMEEMDMKMDHVFRVSGAGSVVMETMSAGTPMEMVNMYYMDGDDLVLTHYCAQGNQPRMRLNGEASTADRLVFAYDGGTNIDVEVDTHIHNAEVSFGEDGSVAESWTAWTGGEEVHAMNVTLARAE